MKKRGLRVVSPFKRGPTLIASVLIGAAAGTCCIGIPQLIWPIGALFLCLPILWVRRDQHAFLLPLRTAILFSSAYLCPLLMLSGSLFARINSEIALSILVATAILLVVGAGWGAFVRAMFQALAYEVVIAAIGCCTSCGYDLTGNISKVCPECGSDTQPASTGDELIARPVRAGSRLTGVGIIVCSDLFLAWTMSWIGPFPYRFISRDYEWTVSLLHGAVQAAGCSLAHGGHSISPHFWMTALLPEFRVTPFRGRDLIEINIPLWIPIALVAYPTILLLRKRCTGLTTAPSRAVD